MANRSFAVAGGRRRFGSKKIRNDEEFKYWCKAPTNCVFYLNKPTCPYCLDFTPMYEFIAQKVHQSNGLEHGFIYMFMMDGPHFRETLNKVKPDLVQFFPSVVFKGGEGRLHVWKPEARSYPALINDMGRFFGGRDMMAVDVDMDRLLDSETPRYVYFYKQILPLVPRFVLNRPMVDVLDGCMSTSMNLLNRSEVARATCAVDVDKLDRPDIPYPSLYDMQTKEFHSLRELQRWLDLPPNQVVTTNIAKPNADETRQ